MAKDPNISLGEAIQRVTVEMANEKIAMLQSADATKANEQAKKDLAEADRNLQAANKDLIDNAIAQTEANKSYQKSQDEILAQIDELKTKKGELYSWETDKRTEIDEQITGLQEKYAEDAQAFEDASNRKLAMMTLEKIAMLDGQAGFSNAEAEKALAIAETTGVVEASAIRQAVAFDQVSTAMATGKMRAEDMNKVLLLMSSKGYSIDVALNVIASMANANTFLSGSHTTHTQQTQQGGFADGGISTGSNSGHAEMLHGTEAVIPLKGGSIPVQLQGGGMGGDFSELIYEMRALRAQLPDAIARSNRSIFEKVGR
jgi:hypothetical protein